LIIWQKNKGLKENFEVPECSRGRVLKWFHGKSSRLLTFQVLFGKQCPNENQNSGVMISKGTSASSLFAVVSLRTNYKKNYKTTA
jgi:hypothetical protein